MFKLLFAAILITESKKLVSVVLVVVNYCFSAILKC